MYGCRWKYTYHVSRPQDRSPRNWSYRRRELNLGPFREQHMQLATAPSLQHHQRLSVEIFPYFLLYLVSVGPSSLLLHKPICLISFPVQTASQLPSHMLRHCDHADAGTATWVQGITLPTLGPSQSHTLVPLKQQ